MPEKFEIVEPTDEAVEASADIPRLVIMDKRLIEALELLGVRVRE